MIPHGGPDALSIPPAAAVAEPVAFATARGDDADPALDEMRRGLADVRLEVFVVEQGVPLVEEIDARDFEASTLHVLARGADGTPLGAGRILLEPGHPGQVHLGRLAVRRAARGTGLGARLVSVLESVALERAGAPLGARAAAAVGAEPGTMGVRVVLSAQERAMGFYERCGYRALDGGRYLDAGIWHRDMARTVTAPAPGSAQPGPRRRT